MPAQNAKDALTSNSHLFPMFGEKVNSCKEDVRRLKYESESGKALDAAIRLLDGPAEAGHYDRHSGRGEKLEAAGTGKVTA